MDSTIDSLKYVDETDKSFGLAGMAISLIAWDAREWLEAIDLDAAPDEAMRMSADFYFTTAPRVGAKAVWEQALTRFRLTAAMTVANVACREMAHHGHSQLPVKIDSALREVLTEEGANLCGLDNDEVSRIYGKALAYCGRLFSHPGVKRLAESCSNALRDKRSMSSAEIFEILAPLARL